MSRPLFLLFSVALLVAAACCYGGVRPGEIARVCQTELRDDVLSLREDVHIVRQQSEFLQSDVHALLTDTRAQMTMLQADAQFEAHRLARPFAEAR